ncbi:MULTISPECIES: extracellular solute-binding protein [Polymorphospora]|uniref:Extracellular solute-binding protein n=1 Tax=Polymorphospora lycopeni TaxID=3140240 RepID=A0ABV5CLD7_9ACTN
MRRGAAGALAAVLAATVAGCGGGDEPDNAAQACEPADGPVTLEYYSWVPGIDKVIDIWNAKNPDIQVKFVTGPAGPDGAYQNFFNGIKAGNAPDLAQVEYDSLASFRLQDGLVNLADCEGVPEVKDKFVPWTWQQVSFGEADAVYAVPQDIGPIGMYYRADLFQEAGLQPPTTWEEYYEAAKVIRTKGGHIHHFASGDVNWFLGQIWQAGGQWFSVDGDQWTVSLTGSESQQVANYWQRMLDEDLARPMAGWSDEWWNAMNTGEIWTWVSPYWANALLSQNAPDASGKWAVAYMPQWTAGQRAAGNWGGSTTAVLRSTEHPYEAAKFATWLNSDPEALQALNENGGLYPATVEGQRMPALAKPLPYFGDQDISGIFAEAAGNVDADFPWGPTMTQTYSDVRDGFARAIEGNGNLTTALESAQNSTVDALKSQSIPVAGN